MINVELIEKTKNTENEVFKRVDLAFRCFDKISPFMIQTDYEPLVVILVMSVKKLAEGFKAEGFILKGNAAFPEGTVTDKLLFRADCDWKFYTGHVKLTNNS
jgi:hypothetical protein